jgi:histidine triad (HIT) family protein
MARQESKRVEHTGETAAMPDDLFLKIINREIPADIVYETDQVLAFRDINPQAPVHILVIPKQQIRTLDDLEQDDVELAGTLLLAAAEIARNEGLSEEGYRVVVNCKHAGGQMVYHIHLHILGGRRMNWPPG